MTHFDTYPTSRHPELLNREQSVLVVVDMQESFLAVMHAPEALIANVLLLCRAAKTLGIPILATTQYAARLGSVLPKVSEILNGGLVEPEEGRQNTQNPFDKLVFSCAGSEAFCAALTETGRKQVVLCGVETHICVTQTAYDLHHAGYAVHVAADAVSSRTLEKHKLGMERIRDGGIKPCATESAVYEWLYAAGTPEFKEILKWVK